MMAVVLHAAAPDLLFYGDGIAHVYVSYGIALKRPEIYLNGLFEPPLFHFLLAALFRIFSFSHMIAVALNIALGFAGIGLCYALARRLFDPAVALAAALFVALNPYGTALSLSGVAEPAYAVLLLFFFLAYLSYWRDPTRWPIHLAATAALSLAVLTRYEALGFAACVWVFEARMLLKDRSRPHARMLAFASFAGPALLMTIWTCVLHRLAGDAFAWFHVVRGNNLGTPVENMFWFFFRSLFRAYPVLSFMILGLALSALRRPSRLAFDRIPACFALLNLAALCLVSTVHLGTPQDPRTLWTPIVVLSPFAAETAVREMRRLFRAPFASLFFFALIAQYLVQSCGTAYSSLSYEPAPCRSGRELGNVLRELRRLGASIPANRVACANDTMVSDCEVAAVFSDIPGMTFLNFTGPSQSLALDRPGFMIRSCGDRIPPIRAHDEIVLKRTETGRCLIYRPERSRRLE